MAGAAALTLPFLLGGCMVVPAAAAAYGIGNKAYEADEHCEQHGCSVFGKDKETEATPAGSTPQSAGAGKPRSIAIDQVSDSPAPGPQ